MLRRILVGLAGTSFTPVAIQQAVKLAQTHGSQVTGATILNMGLGRSTGLVGSEHGLDDRKTISHSNIEQAIADFESACETANVEHRVVRESVDPFSQLVALSRYHDLMIFGLRSIFTYDFRAGDPESLLIRMIGAGVRPLVSVSEQHRDVARVLIAYNGSMESAKAMKRFVQMQLWPNAKLKIFTFHDSDAKADELTRDAEDYCRAHGFDVCSQSNPGDPKTLLLLAASMWQADMIVMGNSARNVLLRRVLGDTLLQTLRGANIPLFLAQ
jgi:nucleotide-binding universal stress UspA family protein